MPSPGHLIATGQAPHKGTNTADGRFNRDLYGFIGFERALYDFIGLFPTRFLSGFPL